MHPRARGYESFAGRVEEFAAQSRPAWPVEPRAAGPNVVIVLVDDLGFSDLGAFGSEIDTPHIDSLAESGWVFTDYHTAPMCSPSRAALLTGMNPHRAGFGFVSHVDPGYPGFACELPANAPTLAESLRADGYATFMVGKWHLTRESQLHDGADKRSWPLQRGFDRYYGSMDGFTSLHHPHRLIRDNSPVDIPEFADDYFLTDDLTDHALGMIDDLRSSDADRPFFLYFAHTAVHGPIQAKSADIERYRGRYAAGWDHLRTQRLRRQAATGIVAPGATMPDDELFERTDIPRWQDLDPAEQELLARHMEVYAAAVTEVDQSVGRLLAKLDELGERENTIVVVTSDNGGTAEGGRHGTRSYFAQFGTEFELPPAWERDVPRDPTLIGGPRLFGQYPAGWARVSNTPFRDYKGSTYEGGIHAPLVLSWPGGPARGADGVRRQFAFVTDLAPTILELTGVAPLQERSGRAAADVDGKSFAATLGDATSPPRAEQYFECLGRRALYRDGLKVVSRIPPSPEQGAAGGDWELYDLRRDPTETSDLASRHPEIVAELALQWREDAWRNTVFPIDPSGKMFAVRPATEERLSNPVIVPAFRPPLERYRSAKLTVMRSFDVEIDVDVADRSSGILVAHGDQGGGYSLAVDGGEILLAYNAYGRMSRARGLLAPGPRRIVLRVTEQHELHWALTVTVDGVDTAQIPGVPMLIGMAPFTGISVGYDYGSPVDWELYLAHRSFPLREGTLRRVRYVPGARSSHDPVRLHAIDEAVTRIAD